MALEGAAGGCSGRGGTVLLSVMGDNVQASLVAIGLEIVSRDEPLAGKDRKTEIPILPLCGGLEDLEHLIEFKELTHPAPIPQHGVEGREQHAVIGPRSHAAQSLG